MQKYNKNSTSPKCCTYIKPSSTIHTIPRQNVHRTRAIFFTIRQSNIWSVSFLTEPLSYSLQFSQSQDSQLLLICKHRNYLDLKSASYCIFTALSLNTYPKPTHLSTYQESWITITTTPTLNSIFNPPPSQRHVRTHGLEFAWRTTDLTMSSS